MNADSEILQEFSSRKGREETIRYVHDDRSGLVLWVRCNNFKGLVDLLQLCGDIHPYKSTGRTVSRFDVDRCALRMKGDEVELCPDRICCQVGPVQTVRQEIPQIGARSTSSYLAAPNPCCWDCSKNCAECSVMKLVELFFGAVPVCDLVQEMH